MKLNQWVKALALSTILFFAGCATTKQGIAADYNPQKIAQRADSLRTLDNLSDRDQFLLEFADSKKEKGMSLDHLVNNYLPENLFYLHYNGGKLNGKFPRGWGPDNRATTVYIGNNLFLTANHVVDNFPDSVWTDGKPANLDSVWGMSASSLSQEEKTNSFVKPYSLKNEGTGKNHIFRVVARKDDIDVALLEIQENSNFSDDPLLYLDSRQLSKGDTIIHFMNSVYGNEWKFRQSVKDKKRTITTKNNRGKEIAWIEYTPLQSKNKHGKPWYLHVQGTVFPFTERDLKKRRIYSGDLIENNEFDISSMMSYNGNSGAPLFRKQGDKYYLISVIKGGRSSSPNEYHDLYGIDAQRKTTTFGKPELLQEFLIETVENRDK